jgi:formylglycine-generating enzyme required for sulfatase activity
VRGFTPLIDRTDIFAFEDWWKRIQTLICSADTIVFVISPESVSSDICRKEVALGASLNKRFAPVVYVPADAEAVPAELSSLHFIFFEQDDCFEKRIGELVDALSTDIEWIRKHTEFGELARRWSDANRPRPKALLLRSPLLEEAERWTNSRAAGAPLPTSTTLSFISESRRVATRRRNFQIGASALLCLVPAATIFGWSKTEYIKDTYYFRVDMGGAALSASREHRLKPGEEFVECTKGCPTMVVIPPGHFLMGSSTNEDRVRGLGPLALHMNEQPQHFVTISMPFAVSKYVMSFAEWDACVSAGICKGEPKEGHGLTISLEEYFSPKETRARDSRRPAFVRWEQAQSYINWLGKMTGKLYRFLSESEWEYSARAGTTTAYYWGNNIGKGNANCDGCGSPWDSKQTAPVGSFTPNAFGLYDMAGNASQLVEDTLHEDYNMAPTDGSAWTGGQYPTVHIDRGGSFYDNPKDIRSATRAKDDQGAVRVARTLSP